MGGSKSKECPPPPPSPLLPEPWRELDWSKRDEMIDHLRRFQISTPDVKILRILVHGPVGAGKSSFINSIDSIFQGRMTSGAIAEACAGNSFTKRYKTHKIKDGGYGSHLPFVFCDVMGLERGDSEGVKVDDLKKILNGHIKEGYVFNQLNSLPEEEDKGYIKDPNLSDKIHCLVSVIPADSLLWCADSRKISDHAMKEKDEAFIKKIKDVRAHASMMDIPQVVILSKVDEACSEVQKDIKMIYRSKTIREKIQLCSVNVGVPQYCIFPVKNYHDENQMNNDMDVLLLTALTDILNHANDHVADTENWYICIVTLCSCNSLCDIIWQDKMGYYWSKPSPPPDPSNLLETGWRKINWGKGQNNEMKENLKKIQPKNPALKQLRAVVIGPVGCGKSSFIQSVKTIFLDKMINAAGTVATGGTSFTKTYTTNIIKDERGQNLPFVISDVMGLENGRDSGVQTEDIISVLKGHIKEGYTFNPVKSCSDEIKRRPILNDKVHCLVFVIPIDNFRANGCVNNDLFNKMKDIRQKACDLGIPQVVILTKVDEACPHVKEDITLVYRSQHIYNKMKACSEVSGIPMSDIFPVKNYHEEVQLNPDMDALLLFTLTRILNYANDFVENIKEPEGAGDHNESTETFFSLT
ncbi:uncharacterized protein LOC143116929 [Alosa pseudoharengus]|uniref:uncharacterized protein LOC143116929 n=1 Tax=Alosa pseudoharengus TaxID=34774 RepID=UPI003F89FA56